MINVFQNDVVGKKIVFIHGCGANSVIGMHLLLDSGQVLACKSDGVLYVWMEEGECDECYNMSVKLTMEQIARGHDLNKLYSFAAMYGSGIGQDCYFCRAGDLRNCICGEKE